MQLPTTAPSDSESNDEVELYQVPESVLLHAAVQVGMSGKQLSQDNLVFCCSLLSHVAAADVSLYVHLLTPQGFKLKMQLLQLKSQHLSSKRPAPANSQAALALRFTVTTVAANQPSTQLAPATASTPAAARTPAVKPL